MGGPGFGGAHNPSYSGPAVNTLMKTAKSGVLYKDVMDLRQRMRVIFINNLYLKITIDRNDRK
jgi:hypothetical protein